MSKIFRSSFSILLSGVILGSFVAIQPVARAQTIDDLQAQIQALQQQVQSLLSQIATVQSQVGNSGLPTPPGISIACAAIFSHSLYVGVNDATTAGEVTKLQKFLAQDKVIYPEGLVTGYFGALTEKAVQRWQAKQGIISSGSASTSGYGVVGPKTREALNRVCNGPAGSATAPKITKLTPASSSVADLVTIAGTGFSTSSFNTVYFGSASIPNLVSLDGKTIFFNVPSSTPGQYLVLVGSNGGFSNSLSFQVKGSPFAVFASGTITLQQPLTAGTNSASNTISAAPVGTSTLYLVSFSQKGFPTGATAGAIAACVAPCSGMNTVTIHNTTPPGTYPITVVATFQGNAAATTYNLVVIPAQVFSFRFASTTNITVARPNLGSVVATSSIPLVTLSGVPQAVTFAQSGLPTGVTATTISSCKPSCASIDTLTIRASSTPGTYPITLTATGAGFTATTIYNLVINESQQFGFSLSNSGDITVVRPVSGTALASNTISASLASGYGQSVAFTQSGWPTGASAATLTSCVPNCTRTNTVTIRNTTPAGTYPITARATGGGLTSATVYNLNVVEPDMVFTVDTTGDVFVNRPDSGIATSSNAIVATLLDGIAQPVTFSQSGLPSGASITSLSSCTPTCQIDNLVTVNSNVAPNVYPITVIATAANTSSTAEYNLIVQ